ncbi:MAG: ATP-binding cassette domain-containing protein [Streptosporangiales bacterium]|nr:ATP-binding cassette domain-containing protein [Streptosporangiales bacterium]
MAFLDVRDLHTFYRDTEALKGASLDVEEGEIVALLGSNGAGKTTTLRTISGLQRARSGAVIFDGSDLTRARPHEIVSAGLVHVPEGRRIFSGLTVDENLSLGAYLSRGDRKRMSEDRDAVYALFPRLVERRRQVAGTLSGGEQQMLAIGRALMSRPRLLALDEPSMGLAPAVVRAVGQVIQRIRAAGTTILMVEQNVRQALRLADRAFVLETGRVVLSGPAGELAADPRVQAAYLGGSASVDEPPDGTVP